MNRALAFILAGWIAFVPSLALADGVSVPGVPTIGVSGAAVQFPPQSGGGGPVAIDNAATPVHNTAGGTQTVSLASFTVGSGAHRYMLVQIVTSVAFTTDTISCNWNNGSAQNFSTTPITISASKKTVMMGLVAPNSGTGTITCSWNVSYFADFYFEVITFTGVNQSSPVVVATPSTGTGTAVSLSVPVSSSNDMAVDCAHNTGGDTLTTPTQTSFWNGVYGGSSHGTGSSSVLFGWTAQYSGDTWEDLGVDLVAG